MYDVMIMGASYGALLGIKLCAAGHSATLVCLPDEADLINREGQRVRLPVKGRVGLVEVDSRSLPGRLSGATTDSVDPAAFDLVALAMQEPQYGAPGVRELLDAVARSGVPCMSIMNMPPLPYLARVPGLDVEPLRACYADPAVWDSFDPANMTLCSPDAQAFRPPDEKTNVLQVSLPTNFRAARFESDEHTAILRALAADVEAIRYDDGKGPVELPVKLKVHDSIFVPLAKWSMLLAGNYRCVQREDMRSIRDAVHRDLDLSRSVYDWVNSVCRAIGASEGTTRSPSRSMRTRRRGSSGLRPRRGPCSPALPGSSAPTIWSRRSRPGWVCGRKSWTRAWGSSTAGWPPTAGSGDACREPPRRRQGTPAPRPRVAPSGWRTLRTSRWFFSPSGGSRSPCRFTLPASLLPPEPPPSCG